MTELLKLAERVEAAEAGGMRLGHDVLVAVGQRHPDAIKSFGYPASHLDPATSIDAAVTLLPAGSLWAVVSMEDGPLARLLWPNPDGTYTGNYVETTATTPALALCAAALRARSA